MALAFLLRPVLLVSVSIATAAATNRSPERNGHSLRHTETSVVVLVEPPKAAALMQEPLPQAPTTRATAVAEDMLFGSMASMLQNKEEVMDEQDPKAPLRRQLVSLIWLERVLQENLASMDEQTYRAKIAKSKAGLEKDSTPETAEMLSKMRTEMHEFSVPFFRSAVKEELEELHARQQALLNKIVGREQDTEHAAETPEQKDESVVVKEKKEKKQPAPTEADAEAQAQIKAERRARSNMFIFLMVAVASCLILLLLGIGFKVHSHQRRRAGA